MLLQEPISRLLKVRLPTHFVKTGHICNLLISAKKMPKSMLAQNEYHFEMLLAPIQLFNSCIIGMSGGYVGNSIESASHKIQRQTSVYVTRFNEMGQKSHF